jgi:hypothetical protein
MPDGSSPSTGPRSSDSMTSTPLEPTTSQLSMFSLEDFPVRTSPTQASGTASTARAPASGGSSPASFASFDPGTSSWRTSQRSVLGGWDVFSGTWPRAGMTRNGTAFRLLPLAPLTRGTASSWLPTPSASPYGSNQSPSPRASVRLSLESMARRGVWPTPRATDGDRGGRGDLLHVVRAWPTPAAADAKGALRYSRGNPSLTLAARGDAPGGQLNPTWVEWLMGFPPGWTDCGDSETP